MKRLLPLFLLGAAPLPAVNDALIMGDTLPYKLSEFRLLFGQQGQSANIGVMPYTLRTPLFTDYAEKWRYLYVPKGSKIAWTGDGLPSLPVGSVLIKSFGYPAATGVRMIETRLLVHRAAGWVAFPYVWDADGKDATLKRAGYRTTVSTSIAGKPVSIEYAVPNVNQCKGCHDVSGAISPIGPKARNLDGQPFGKMPDYARLPKWDDPSAPLAGRARAYLDVNCAHCHQPKGPASNSGLFLTWDEKNTQALGILKRPVAAGRGAGNLDFDIDPGHADRSILTYRMASLEPGIAMPELGRSLHHDEGITLIREWIDGMPSRDAER